MHKLAEVLCMSNHAATARTTTYRAERTPSPLLGTLICLAVLAGGAFAGTDWAAAQCTTGTNLGVVCTVVA